MEPDIISVHPPGALLCANGLVIVSVGLEEVVKLKGLMRWLWLSLKLTGSLAVHVDAAFKGQRQLLSDSDI